MTKEERADFEKTAEILKQLDKPSLTFINNGTQLLKARQDLELTGSAEKKVG